VRRLSERRVKEIAGGEAVDAGPWEFGFFVGGDGVFDNGDPERAVVLDEGFGAAFEEGEFAADGGEGVIDAAGSVAAGVGADALADGVRRAGEVDEVGNADELVDVGGLAEVSREAVEDDQVGG